MSASGPGTCGYGERWDDGSQSCIPDGSGGSSGGDYNQGGGSNPGTGNPQSCPPGQHRDGDGLCAPDAPNRGHDCPAGYEWEDVGPNGRCKVAGTNFEDGCYIRPEDGKTYCNDSPYTGGDKKQSGGLGGFQASDFQTPDRYQFTPWTAPAKTPFELSLEEDLQGFLDNWDKSVPFTPGIVQGMKTDAFRNSFGRSTADRNAINADAIQRGVFRASHTGDRMDNARRGYESQFATDSRNIDQNAAVQNDAAQYRNHIAALDRAQQHVDNERQFLLQSQMSDFERQSGLAQIQLAYYRLEQERWAAQNGFNLSSYGYAQQNAQFNLQLQMAILQALQAA